MYFNLCQTATFVSSQVFIPILYRRNAFILPNYIKRSARRTGDLQSQIKLNHYQITGEKIIEAQKITLIEIVCIFLFIGYN